MWFSRGEGTCAAHLASVPVAGGKEERLPGSGEAGPEGTPLPRPGRAQIAYARIDCKEPGAALDRRRHGRPRGSRPARLVPLAWSRDGARLLATAADSYEARLLEVNESGAIVGHRELDLSDPPRSAGSRWSGSAPTTTTATSPCGAAVCGESVRRSLVLLDKDGRFRKTVVRLPRGQDFIDRPAFDPTGHSLLFSSAPAQLGGDDDATEDTATDDSGITLWLWRDGETRRLARQSGYRHPSWLP